MALVCLGSGQYAGRQEVLDVQEKGMTDDGCLQAFLLYKSAEKSTWAKTLSDSRSAYTSLREHFLKNIEHPDDISAEDPLTDTETVSHTVLQLCIR